MADIFSETSRIDAWRRVEVAAAVAGAEEGLWPRGLASLVQATPAPSPVEVSTIESTVRHEVVAFLLTWSARMDDEALPIIHRGLTSSDVVDTALSLQLVAASGLIADRLDELFTVLRSHALDHRDTVRLGRTHGQAATVDTWGHRVADFAFAVDRCRERFDRAAADIAVAKLSGPTGAHHDVSPAIERRVAAFLGLEPAGVSTQVLMRDRLAAWISTMSITVSVCEAVALEVRLGQHDGVRELYEAFADKQAGSWSMPHKHNPIDAERICGLARLVRALVLPITEGVALWHERDLSQSSVERVAVPDAVSLTEHILTTTTRLIAGLHVDSSAMRAAVDAAGAAVITHRAVGILGNHGITWPNAWALVRDVSNTGARLSRQQFVDLLAAGAPSNGTRWAEALQSLAGPLAASPAGMQLDDMFDQLQRLPETRTHTYRRRLTGGGPA